ncbi:MAG: glycoside hydrolase family 57 protein, partial [Leptolyngbyaceae cyanobacterium bins.59]|nr:glycoside hydrolase family 57 protein [Leptolyngbyaceae cyanobacterium bins.59]
EQWLKRGKGFTLDDRQQIYAKQQEIIRRIIPQHRKMQEAGQLEITTSPYTHPILPLLADTDAGRVAVPNMALPEQRFQWAEDIPRHLRKARDLYQDRFGTAPRGLWPSEQSVSPAILPHVAEAGFQWLCSDEAILGWTIHHFFHRDGLGNVYEPELLYRPYRLKTPAGDLAIVFRDHRLSDLIGFTYGAMEPRRATSDLVGHLESIARTLRQRQPEGDQALQHPWLVTIALDGENCWEFYPQDGKPFLETLYQTLSDTPGLQLVTVSEFLDRFPPTETLPSDHLHSGSWVDGNFTTWIGDRAKNRAWDLLTDARRVLANHPEATEESRPDVWEALYAAEGSDWFWWFGEGHTSNHDAIFDQLFREHLIAIYEALQEPVPSELYSPVEFHSAPGDHMPQSFIHPTINGRCDKQEWDKAGRIEIGGARGTMHRSSTVQKVWYGVDHFNFYLRVDLRSGTRPGTDCPAELNLVWYYPDQPMHNSPLPLGSVPDQSPLNYRFHHFLGINLITQTVRLMEAIEHDCWEPRTSRTQVALDQCLELAVPWADLQPKPDWSLRLLLIFSENGQFQSFLPEETQISLYVP